jgi:hypothetical protein
MLVSTFELLVKPIAPAGSGPAPVARTVVQGYFLTIANPNNTPVSVKLTFAATTPTLDVTDTVAIRDVAGNNLFGDLVPTADPRKLTYTLRIPAHDTALVTLLPDLTKPAVLAAKSLEVRGYVEVALNAPVGRFDLLITPEHRGTFLPVDLSAPMPDFDQLAYALPTATGGSLFTLTRLPIRPPVAAPIGAPGNGNGRPLPEIEEPETPAFEVPAMMSMVLQRLEALERRMAMV